MLPAISAVAKAWRRSSHQRSAPPTTWSGARFRIRAKSCRNSSSASTEKRGSPFSPNALRDLRPVFGRQVLPRRGHDHLRLEVHVLHLRRRETLDGRGERGEARRRDRPRSRRGSLRARRRALPGGVLALELVERVVELRRARAQLAEQVGVFLRVVQRLGEGADVVQHRVQQRKRRRAFRVARLADQVLEAVDHRGERAMLVADDGRRRGVGAARRGCSRPPRRAPGSSRAAAPSASASRASGP